LNQPEDTTKPQIFKFNKKTQKFLIFATICLSVILFLLYLHHIFTARIVSTRTVSVKNVTCTFLVVVSVGDWSVSISVLNGSGVHDWGSDVMSDDWSSMVGLDWCGNNVMNWSSDVMSDNWSGMDGVNGLNDWSSKDGLGNVSDWFLADLTVKFYTKKLNLDF
jgi:hypothetical protein